MNHILHGYQVNEATWFYLSFVLILAVYFRFGRFWSLRNLDLILMLGIAPALLYVQESPADGAFCLLIVTFGLLGRVLFDAYFTRRPKLPQNMAPAGLAFLCLSAMAFLGTKVLTDQPPVNEVREVERARQPGQGAGLAVTPHPEGEASGHEAGPGARLIYAAVTAIATTPNAERPAATANDTAMYVARCMAILAHLAVIGGLICVAYYHMGDLHLGLAMATLYLLLPCTAYEVGRINHVLPSAMIVWAFVAYKRVAVAGALLGLACGTLFFPIFLLPLWAAFYGRRGWLKFCFAVGGMTLVMIAGLWLLAGPVGVLPDSSFGFFDWTKLRFNDTEPTGFWSIFPAAYRVPAFVSFVAMVIALSIWPRYKDLANLMASSAAIVIATQLWYPQQGSVYVLWYLPLLLMVVFRPPLHHSLAPDALQLAQTVTTSVEPRSSSLMSSGVSTGTAFR